MCQMESFVDQQSILDIADLAKRSPAGDDVLFSPPPLKAEKTLTAPSSGESGKKKRVQRAAKLKQCKMDARREQWLAQVSGKVVKRDTCGTSQDDRDEKEMLLQPSSGELGTLSLVDKELIEDSQCKQPIDSGLTNELSCVWPDGVFCNQQGCLMDGNKQESLCHQQSLAKPLDHREAARKVMWSTCDTSSSKSNNNQASNGTDDENEVEDWEAVADALHVQATVEDVKPATSNQYLVMNRQANSRLLSGIDMDKCILKPEIKYRPGNFRSRLRADVGRAWRPDDVSRPPMLPRLSKQHSFPRQSGPSLWATSHTDIWGLPPPPTHCPICTEELDSTDSSFVPCFCGFRLCLFCHHRILLSDGRCPGCRKSYNSEAALKLSRTWSARS